MLQPESAFGNCRKISENGNQTQLACSSKFKEREVYCKCTLKGQLERHINSLSVVLIALTRIAWVTLCDNYR